MSNHGVMEAVCMGPGSFCPESEGTDCGWVIPTEDCVTPLEASSPFGLLAATECPLQALHLAGPSGVAGLHTCVAGVGFFAGDSLVDCQRMSD